MRLCVLAFVTGVTHVDFPHDAHVSRRCARRLFTCQSRLVGVGGRMTAISHTSDKLTPHFNPRWTFTHWLGIEASGLNGSMSSVRLGGHVRLCGAQCFRPHFPFL